MRAWIVLALAALTVACEPSEGDYIVFRVNVSSFESGAACFGEDGTPPPNEALDENTLRTGQTWVLYVGLSDRLILDAAGQALRGDSSDDGYAFVADDIDVTYVGVDQREVKVTEQITTTVDMLTDGSAVSGSITAVETTSCDFLVANPSSGLCGLVPTCTRTASFAGVELDDVELTESVDPAPPPPAPAP